VEAPSFKEEGGDQKERGHSRYDLFSLQRLGEKGGGKKGVDVYEYTSLREEERRGEGVRGKEAGGNGGERKKKPRERGEKRSKKEVKHG